MRQRWRDHPENTAKKAFIYIRCWILYTEIKTSRSHLVGPSSSRPPTFAAFLYAIAPPALNKLTKHHRLTPIAIVNALMT